MPTSFSRFERIARGVHRLSQAGLRPRGPQHPFDVRNVSPDLPVIVKTLFDDGHYAQATFEAYKFLDNKVQGHASSSESGFKLMMQVFGGLSPAVQLTPMKTMSEKDEQKGFQFIFAGSILAIRNPRGHMVVVDDPDLCLDHLCLASMLLRRLADAGFK